MVYKKQTAYLCIGGPYDGRRYVSNGLNFKVPKLIKSPSPFRNPMIDQVSGTVEWTYYIADRIRCSNPDDEVWFWRPENQSVKTTMNLLLERYEQSNNLIWSESPFQEN